MKLEATDTMAGYSDTPLINKLGIKSGLTIRLVNQPDNYLRLVGKLPSDVTIVDARAKSADFIHCFATQRPRLAALLPQFLKQLTKDGMIWISWPKKTAKVPTDLTEDVVREVALPLGLVDVKVCAVDDYWSGLKLVIRKENR